jgi:glycine hydroxymethyltransferase
MILSQGTVGNPLKAPEPTLDNIPTLIDRSIFPGFQGGPHMHQTLAIAVALGEAMKPEFKTYAAQIVKNAKKLADEMMKQGFKLVTNGTDNHLILADVQTAFGINGKVAEEALDKIGLTLNKNAIPNDPNPPFKPSGIRLGTPALTTRGMREEHMAHIAQWMKQAIDNRADDKKLESIRQGIKAFLKDFPVPA